MRVAIIGAGMMGEWHARAAHRAGSEIALVIDPDESRGRRLAQRFPGAVWSSDAGALADFNVRSAHVCTPLADHAGSVERAVSAGVSCLVEKPLAPTAALTARLLDMAKDREVIVCPSHQYLYQRGVLSAIASLATIGQLRHCVAICCTAGARGGVDPALLAIDILPHQLSLYRRLIGDAFGSLEWRAGSSGDGEITAFASDSTTSLTIVVSTSGRPTRNEADLIAERGSVHLDLFHGFAVRSGSRVSRASKAARPIVESSATLITSVSNLVRRAVAAETAFPGMDELVRQYYSAVRDRRPSPIGPGETLDVATARDSIAQALSDASGRSAGLSAAAGDAAGGRPVT